MRKNLQCFSPRLNNAVGHCTNHPCLHKKKRNHRVSFKGKEIAETKHKINVKIESNKLQNKDKIGRLIILVCCATFQLVKVFIIPFTFSMTLLKHLPDGLAGER